MLLAPLGSLFNFLLQFGIFADRVYHLIILLDGQAVVFHYLDHLVLGLLLQLPGLALILYIPQFLGIFRVRTRACLETGPGRPA